VSYAYINQGATYEIFAGHTSVPFPASTTNGRLLLLAATNDSSGALPTTPTGFTSLVTSSADCSVGLYGKISDGTEGGTNLTVTPPSGAGWAHIVQLSGNPATLAGIVNTSSNTQAVNFSPPFWSALTITNPNLLVLSLVHCYCTTSASSGIDTPSPWTNQFGTNFDAGDANIFGWDYVIQTSGANISSNSWTVTFAGTMNYESITVALNPAAAASLPPPRLKKRHYYLPLFRKF